MVRVEGLEPPQLASLDPKSSASTNSATPAYILLKIYRIEFLSYDKNKSKHIFQKITMNFI